MTVSLIQTRRHMQQLHDMVRTTTQVTVLRNGTVSIRMHGTGMGLGLTKYWNGAGMHRQLQPRAESGLNRWKSTHVYT